MPSMYNQTDSTMKRYFIRIQGKPSAPLTLTELKSSGIKKTTFVWFEGLNDWTEAGKLWELDILFESCLSSQELPDYSPLPLPSITREPFLSHTYDRVLLGSLCLIIVMMLLISFAEKSREAVIEQDSKSTFLILQTDK